MKGTHAVNLLIKCIRNIVLNKLNTINLISFLTLWSCIIIYHFKKEYLGITYLNTSPHHSLILLKQAESSDFIRGIRNKTDIHDSSLKNDHGIFHHRPTGKCCIYIYIFTFFYKVELLESHSRIVFKCLIHHAILTSTGNMLTKLFSFLKFFLKIYWTVWKWNYKLLVYFREKMNSLLVQKWFQL
jgi:hypothetical protein